ncbi:M16 family metallopeptidase [Kribbia dieselivorans]|uniref:M16 family metallopeptidase n=1 Tax=Kribbia dieselivorans TaxID=331526 RepID=UPI0009FB737D|nr:pitrilysin family protein [Kribbia dieselivorans]
MPLDYAIHERTLTNGLRVVIQPDHRVPTVTVNIWVNVGSRHESPGRTGFAHLFEHLMFQGSANVASGEHFSALMAEGGRLNATTWFDRTNYFETVPTGALELALWLEADRHGHLLEAVNQANLDNQRDVVKEEKRQRYDNVPYGHALSDVYATIFPAGHPYHHPTIGSMEDLDAALLLDVHTFYKQYYGPNNSVLTLVGDVTPEDGFALVKKHFGHLPRSATDQRPRLPQLPPLSHPVRLERVEDVPNDRLYLAFRLPAEGGSEYLATSIALDVLGGLTTSRLETRLVRGDEMANSVHTAAMGLIDGVSLGLVIVDIADGQDVAQVENAVVEELERLGAEGVTEAEMQAVLAQSERGWLTALAANDDRADIISHFATLHHDAQYINTFLDRLGEITATRVGEVARTWLRGHQRAVVTYRARPATADRAGEPAEGALAAAGVAGDGVADVATDTVEGR